MNTAPAVAAVAAAAKRQQWRIMTAESCTGGLIAAALTDAAGASDWFSGGIIAYCNALKTRLLNVPEKILTAHGAVSEQTAQAMCTGLIPLGADAGVAVTGIAGPGNGSKEKTVGAVCFAWQTPETSHAATMHFNGNREQVRASAMLFALKQLAIILDSAPIKN